MKKGKKRRRRYEKPKLYTQDSVLALGDVGQQAAYQGDTGPLEGSQVTYGGGGQTESTTS